MATFRTSQGQDGNEVLEFYEWRCQRSKRRYRKPKHTKEHIKKDWNRYFVEQIWTLYIWDLLSSKLLRAWSSWSPITYNISKIHIWTKRAWNYSLISLVTIWLHIRMTRCRVNCFSNFVFNNRKSRGQCEELQVKHQPNSSLMLQDVSETKHYGIKRSTLMLQWT